MLPPLNTSNCCQTSANFDEIFARRVRWWHACLAKLTKLQVHLQADDVMNIVQSQDHPASPTGVRGLGGHSLLLANPIKDVYGRPR